MSAVITPTPTPVWRLSVDQYHAMIRSGILTDDDPVELLDGVLVPKMPKNPLHRAVTRLLRQALQAITPADYYVDSQEPITLRSSEPEPDVLIVRGDTRDYLDRHPGPQDLALVAEIADSSLQQDRSVKKTLYAQAGIQVYWLLNLPEQCVEVFSESRDGDYRVTAVYGLDDEILVPIAGKSIVVPVRSVFP